MNKVVAKAFRETKKKMTEAPSCASQISQMFLSGVQHIDIGIGRVFG